MIDLLTNEAQKYIFLITDTDAIKAKLLMVILQPLVLFPRSNLEMALVDVMIDRSMAGDIGFL